MSLIPEFELGLWNAWIFIIPILLLRPIGSKILGRRGPSDQSFSELTGREKILLSAFLVTTISSYFYSVFLPLKFNTIWFYAGLIFYIVGMTMGYLAIYGFATTPIDKPVTKGVYRISRNPMYVGEFLIYAAISLACISWFYLLLGMVAITIRHIVVMLEEQECLKKYGDTYKEYMNRTPRWIGISKSKKSDLD